MGKNKDRKKKGASAVQKPATKAKKKIEKELQKQIEQLGEVKLIFKINQISQFLFRIISNN
jgi:hypothetical protein